MDFDTNQHSVFLLHYHLIMCVKYRNKVINDPISLRLKEMFEYCTCGCKVDRDYNAALNIKTEGLKMIAA